jgi:methylated-DNA-protein-cysteine methyltransferase related protein
MNDFFLRVFDIVKLIPKGKVTTYGHIAKCLGSAKSSRMVGWAMNSSHQYDANIPAHRVVNRKGLLTGRMHFNTPDEMREKLEDEGIIVMDNQIINFKDVLWDPMVLGLDI